MQSRSTWVLARDGTRLATDVHLPDEPRAEGALTFLLRTPYGRRGAFDAVPELAAHLTGLGHVLVSQDVRGKFDSEGRCRPFAQEPSDGADTVTWAASQSWSTGRIVTTGESYCGFTALTAAACGHPSVAAVFAGMTTSRVASRWLDCDGAFRLQLNVEWITLSFGQKALPELPWTIEDWWHDDVEDVDTHDADLTSLRELRLASVGESGDRELAGGLTVPAAEAARVPVVLWGGYWDPLVRGTIEEFRAACAARPHQRHHLELRSVDHLSNPWQAAIDGRTTQPDRARSLVQCYERNLPHLLRALRDEAGTASGGGRVDYADQHGRRFFSGAWPPTAALATIATFAGEVQVPAPGTSDDYPGSGESFVWGTLAAGFPDEGGVAGHQDVASLPFEVAELRGDVVLESDVTWNGGERLVATLAQECPDGRLLRVAEGVASRHSSRATGRVSLDLGPVCHAGTAITDRDGRTLERWWLLIAQESYPRYLPVVQADAWLPSRRRRVVRPGSGARPAPVILHDLALRTAVPSHEGPSVRFPTGGSLPGP